MHIVYPLLHLWFEDTHFISFLDFELRMEIGPYGL